MSLKLSSAFRIIARKNDTLDAQYVTEIKGRYRELFLRVRYFTFHTLFIKLFLY